MSNQVLALHRVSSHRFDLTGVRTGSVRDQLLRSTLIVNALADEKLIGPGRPLLIFGAGAAGINAAMLAAARRTDATVLELTHSLFSSISGSWLRRIDPTEFDWPHPHWKTARFPLVGSIPLPQLSAMCGAHLAAAFTNQWDNFLKSRNGRNGYGTVTLLQGQDAHAFVESDVATHLEVLGRWDLSNPARQARDFGARVSCMGHGKEQVSESPLFGMWNNYAGPEFWTDSDGIGANYPLPAGVSKIVISGAGDGGMQDLQRAATSLFGRELYQQLELAAQTNPSPAIAILPTDTMLKELMSAEETARRAFGWALARQGAPQTLQQWHGTFKQAVEQMVQAWPHNVAQHVAQQLFRAEMFYPDSQLDILWLMQHPTPGYAYALNRYLTVLLCTLADRILPGRITVYPDSTIRAIDSVDPHHVCLSAATCRGKQHRVKIDQGSTPRLTCDADLIIIRHGMEPRGGSSGAPVPEQMTPFDLPH